MMTAILVIIAVFVFFAIISLAFLEGWHSFRDNDILGGVILMWIIVTIFLLVVYFAGRNREALKPSETQLAGNPSTLAHLPVPKTSEAPKRF